MVLKVSIVGASGFVGGELLRLLLGHREVSVQQATSETYKGKAVKFVHPHLRGLTDLRFSSIQDLQECDLLFLALPHGQSMQNIDQYMSIAPNIIDLSADFRLRSESLYREWYGIEHARPDLLKKFVYGIPELHRETIKGSNLLSSAGCNATATILALYPIFNEGIALTERTVVDVMVGTSEGGRAFSEDSHHPIRSGSFRSYKPVGHRHIAEIEEQLNCQGISFSATATDMVRGVLATCHVFLDSGGITEKEIWKIYRKYYGSEPFVRIINEKQGLFRLPDPKLVTGTNFVDIGFRIDERTNRLVVISAIDNLMKGAAGQAVQGMNIMAGFPEKEGLHFNGLFPM